MRFRCNLWFANKNKILIPSDYRSSILSLIKEAIRIENPDFFNKYYSFSPKPKPFTFSVYIPLKNENNKLLLNGNFIIFFFSTNDYEFFMNIYNGLVKLKKFNIFSENAIIKNFYLLPENKITKDTVKFKTLSPFLVRAKLLESSPSNRTKNKAVDGDCYYVPENLNINDKNFKYMKIVSYKEFIEGLKLNLKSLSKTFLGYTDYEFNNLNIEIKFKNLKLSPAKYSSREKFSITLPAIKGEIYITAPKEILQLIYNIGIGARRSEGFGMLNIN